MYSKVLFLFSYCSNYHSFLFSTTNGQTHYFRNSSAPLVTNGSHWKTHKPWVRVPGIDSLEYSHKIGNFWLLRLDNVILREKMYHKMKNFRIFLLEYKNMFQLEKQDMLSYATNIQLLHFSFSQTIYLIASDETDWYWNWMQLNTKSFCRHENRRNKTLKNLELHEKCL